MKPISLIFLILAFVEQLPAQTDTPCSQDSLYHLLDFWVGEWKVYDQQNDLVGSNKIVKILNECAVQENWVDAQGHEGKSLFYVDNSTRNWKQVWVTEQAKAPWGQKEKKLLHSQKDSLLLFQGEYEINGNKVLDRTLLEKISEEEVLQTIQVSFDGGQRWRSTFVGIYRRDL